MPSRSNVQLDDELSWAFSQAWDGGEDSFRRASLIGDNQAQHLLNILVRDNYEARTRPGADAIPTVNTSIGGSVTVAATFAIGVTTIGLASDTGISVGAVVTGTNIAPGTVVTAMTGFAVAPVNTTISANFLIHDDHIVVTSAVGILNGMVVTGQNIAPGTVVTGIAGTTISILPHAIGGGTMGQPYTFSPGVVLSLATTGASAGNYTFAFSGTTKVVTLRYYETQSIAQLLAAGAKGNSAKFFFFSGGAWTDVSSQFTASASNDTVCIVQGVDKAWITDGVQNLQVWDGQNFTDQGDGFTGMQPGGGGNFGPTGATILCWHTSRLFASGVATLRDGIFVSTLLPAGIADGTTVDWDFTNRQFRLGAGDGDPVVAMASMQTTVMAVFKRNSVWLVNTDPVNDAAFTTGIRGFSAAALYGNIGYGIGIVGRDAWAPYGNDILFMSQDGVRSVQRMQAAAGQWQLTAPISQPIQPYIQRINQSAWSGIVAKNYLEFVFFFVPLDNSLTNNYVLVYNARLQTWLGAFTNWNGLCAEVTRFGGIVKFVFGDITGKVNQWKDTLDNQADGTYLDNGVGYPTQVWAKSYQFGETITNKTGNNLNVRFTAGNANVLFSWMADLTQVQQWAGTFQPTGDILGVGVLPFLLQSTAPSILPNGIRGLPDFQEAFLKIETLTGWFWLKSIAASAYINPLQEVFG